MNAGLDELLDRCHYPALPPPVNVALRVCEEHPCPYLPGKLTRTRALYADAMPAEVYHAFMDAGFRRSGKVLYQPVCRGCRQCLQLRVAVGEFQRSKSQRRCWRRNLDLKMRIGEPKVESERLDLYQRYQQQWHGSSVPDRQEYERFLYETPVDTIEMAYRDRTGKLLAVAICDLCSRSFSSVYCYFDPAEARRGLGTYAILREIELARDLRIPWYYLGFWIRSCPAMAYKAAFRPAQILGLDGRWRELNEGLSQDATGAVDLRPVVQVMVNGRLGRKSSRSVRQ